MTKDQYEKATAILKKMSSLQSDKRQVYKTLAKLRFVRGGQILFQQLIKEANSFFSILEKELEEEFENL